ncbi:iron chelate uptake ABC transporter family permease subunit [Tatumella ptyseos]|uniref:iron chelate uptake ABC transporter family permease subunit n=1 Tax=Tatumella ptyseos TaxID=82987 RepID=UPI0026EBDFED|nr:iron chelate uptake ABC transporter family permease subunit [Tatumella ptyseos]WKX26233.1 iron chelate uptake ABC transporter family permease subunit [Tatumella ptyseos]
MASLLTGAKTISPSESWSSLSLWHTCHSENCDIIRYSRLPRTLAGLVAGGALGLAGALMQSLTRNPLADPGLLGVNSGASFVTVVGLSFWGTLSFWQSFSFAFLGALLAAIIVAITGAGRGGRLNPIRLTLAGVSLAAILEGLTSGVSLLNPDIYDHLRFWQTGSLDVRQLTIFTLLGPVVAIAVLCTLALSRSLNALSMGEDLARTLGTRVGLVQLIGLLLIALLSACATALTGPIAFIGLVAPHLARGVLGSDHRYFLPGTVLITPAVLLLADIIGRSIAPGEIRVSIITALIGAPALIILVRHRIGRGM